MQLNLKAGKVANKISVGDSHDLSIEWFITHTDFPFYVIERVGERFKISGAEHIKEEHKDAGKKTGKASETKPQETPKPKPGGKRETGGKRGKRTSKTR